MGLTLRHVINCGIFFYIFSLALWTHPLIEAIDEQDAIKFQQTLISFEGISRKELLVHAIRKYDPKRTVSRRMFEILFTHYRINLSAKTKKSLKKEAPKKLKSVMCKCSKSTVGSTIISRGSAIVPNYEQFVDLRAAILEYDSDTIFRTTRSQIRALAHYQDEEHRTLLDRALQSRQLDVIKLFAEVHASQTVESPEYMRLLELSRLSGNYFEQAQLTIIFDNLIESLSKNTNNSLFWRQDSPAIKALTRFWTHSSSLEHLRNQLSNIGKRKLAVCDEAKIKSKDPAEVRLCEQAMLKMLNDIHEIISQPKSKRLNSDMRFFLILYSAIKTQFVNRAPSSAKLLFLNTLLQRFVFSIIRGNSSTNFNPVLRNLQALMAIIPTKNGAKDNTFSQEFYHDARNKFDDIYRACRSLKSRPPLVKSRPVPGIVIGP